MTGAEGGGLAEIATNRVAALAAQAPSSALSTSSTTAKSAAPALSDSWTRTVAIEGSLVKPT